MADPTTVTYLYRRPDGTSTTLVYGTSAAVVKEATGIYHLDLILDQVGVWTVRVTGTGAVTAPAEQQIIVVSSY